MADRSNDNLLATMRSLIWGAFVGVLSFQVLAPLVWEYLQDALGVPRVIAYWTFTIVYFLGIPAAFLVWLFGNRANIAQVLPYDNHSPTGKGNIFTYGLIAFIIFQLAVTIHGFFKHWSDHFLMFLVVLNAISCGIFLWACLASCYQYITAIIKKDGDSNNDKQLSEGLVKAKAYFKQMFWPIGVLCVLLFLIAFFFEKNWLDSKNANNTQSAYVSGLRSFHLQDVNESVKSGINAIASLEDRLTELGFYTRLDTLARQQTNKATDSSTAVADVFVNYWLTIKVFNKNVDSLLKQLQQHAESVTVSDIDSLMKNRPLLLPDSVTSNATSYNAKSITFIGLIKTYLIANSQKIQNAAKAQMGIQLRSVQAKGMLMLVTLFFTLVALYIFMRVANRTQSIAGELEIEDNRIKKDIEISSSAASSLWLLVTVTAWMLLPIFKLVKDADVNVGSPYKSLTVSSDKARTVAVAEATEGNRKQTGGTTQIKVYSKMDTVNVKLIDTSGVRIDTTSLHQILNEIKSQLNTIEKNQ